MRGRAAPPAWEGVEGRQSRRDPPMTLPQTSAPLKRRGKILVGRRGPATGGHRRRCWLVVPVVAHVPLWFGRGAGAALGRDRAARVGRDPRAIVRAHVHRARRGPPVEMRKVMRSASAESATKVPSVQSLAGPDACWMARTANTAGFCSCGSDGMHRGESSSRAAICLCGLASTYMYAL